MRRSLILRMSFPRSYPPRPERGSVGRRDHKAWVMTDKGSGAAGITVDRVRLSLFRRSAGYRVKKSCR
jgi:hypothetical protein